jgi:signal transduction histidine kinase
MGRDLPTELEILDDWCMQGVAVVDTARIQLRPCSDAFGRHPRKDVSMYARYQAALAELTHSVLANTDLSTLMHQGVTLVAGTLAVAYSAIWEVLPDRNTLVLRQGVGWQDDAVEDTTVEVAPTSLIGTTVLGSTPLVVADWPSETRFSQPPLLRDRNVVSSLYVVIPGQVHPLGSLGVDVPARRMFSDAEISFLQAVANVLALAWERDQTRQTLEQQVENARLLAASQDQAILEERLRLARDLHDSVTQALYGVTLHAQAATRLLAAGDLATTATYLREVEDTAQEALDEMRLMIFELRSPILEQAGLVAALQARLDAVEGRANLHTRLVAGEVGDLPALVEQALYRIAQEALNNALKHAHAQHITVDLRQTQTNVILEVVDDGVGFDPAAVHKTGGWGLCGIAERAAQRGGHLTVQSTPGHGTRVCVELAL